jgi:ribosome-associated translation inhibitor RaiA
MLDRMTINGHTSEALRTHIQDHVNNALNSHEAHVTAVVVSVSDENGPKHGANEKKFHAVVSIRGTGEVIVDERGDDIYAVVQGGCDRLKLSVTRKVEKAHDKHHGAASNPHHSGLVQ